jgi:hypothetical protein
MWQRRQKSRAWEIRITSPDVEGPLLHIDTEILYLIWLHGARSNDGYFDILQMPRLHVWMKPLGWTEPDRIAALDGTGTILPGMP